MADVMVAEHFKLTPAIKTHILHNIEKLRSVIPETTSIRVFLGEEANRVFRVLFKVRIPGKELVAWEAGEEFYSVVNRAEEHLFRRVTQWRRKNVRRKRREARTRRRNHE